MTWHDLLLIVVTTTLCTALVTSLALVAVRLNRRGSIASQLAIIVIATALAIGTSTIAVVVEMFFSPHDLVILAYIIAVSTVLSVVGAWFIFRSTARRSLLALVEATERLGYPMPVPVATPSWREFSDLSIRLEEASQRLGEAREEIEKLDAGRRQFLAWIAHDLRTPLAGMRAMAEAVETGFAAEPIKYVAGIRRKIDLLSEMVDDLFELSRLQGGSFALRCDLISLLDVVSDAVADVSAEASVRRITINQVGIEHHQLWADAGELTRAIGNLLNNGVRHAPDHSEILITAEVMDDDRLMLSVLDQGSGVASEDLGRMFETGWRSDQARTAKSEGSSSAHAGLGLAIVRGIVEAHGGNVRARHVEDRFSLDIILPTATLPSAQRPAPAKDGVVKRITGSSS